MKVQIKKEQDKTENQISRNTLEIKDSSLITNDKQ